MHSLTFLLGVTAPQDNMGPQPSGLEFSMRFGVVLDLVNGPDTEEAYRDRIFEDVGRVIEELMDRANCGGAEGGTAELVVLHLRLWAFFTYDSTEGVSRPTLPPSRAFSRGATMELRVLRVRLLTECRGRKM